MEHFWTAVCRKRAARARMRHPVALLLAVLVKAPEILLDNQYNTKFVDIPGRDAAVFGGDEHSYGYGAVVPDDDVSPCRGSFAWSIHQFYETDIAKGIYAQRRRKDDGANRFLWSPIFTMVDRNFQWRPSIAR